MAAMNRFAQLAPDFEEEESKRKAAAEQKAKKEVQKVKQDEKVKAKADTKLESQGFERSEDQGSSYRGRGRGYERPYRGRGGPQRGELTYVPKDRNAPREPKFYHYEGSNDPVHPFDRKSGTGRGTEVPKRGAGRGNWGTYEDEYRYSHHYETAEEIEEPQKAHEEQPHGEGVKAEEKPGDAKKEESGDKQLGKKDKRKGRKEFKEEKKEDSLDPDGTALTFKEYEAMKAEKQKGLPQKKEVIPIAKDPTKIQGLVAVQKVAEQTNVKKPKSKKQAPTEADKEAEAVVLGGYMPEEERRGRRAGRRRGGRYRRDEAPKEGELAEKAAPAAEEKPGDKPEERPYRGRGGYRSNKGEHEREHAKEEGPKKVEKTPFVMKAEDFPEFKK